MEKKKEIAITLLCSIQGPRYKNQLLYLPKSGPEDHFWTVTKVVMVYNIILYYINKQAAFILCSLFSRLY